MLTRLGSQVRAAIARPLHTNVLGLARTTLALSTMGTLLFSSASDIFRPAVGMPEVPHCGGLTRAGLFCVAGATNLELARWLAVALLAVVASGWRPRVTGVLHWYVASSLFTSGVLVDGGDQAATVLSCLLIPLTLTDPRRWHWEPPVEAADDPAVSGTRLSSMVARFIALTCLWAIRLQVAGIYFQAGVSKLRVTEWRDGTAVYYWFTDPWFGFAEPVRSLVMPVLTSGAAITAITWGSIALEVFLFAGLLATRRTRGVLLALGISFHAAIALVHGLLSFAMVMWAALILFLRPVEEEFGWLRRWTNHWKTLLQPSRALASSATGLLPRRSP
ncbi:sporulation-delaying protein SdpB family protein [Pyxidicoccus trucidator]|uniref:sporulation-delaying protein SdpB family protein n=1 Tax=Pyxidicoccus trucidator TaxID=2709662 RepID=UPI0013DAF9BD|nr:sporulation-delaying protein SdpB family protein [Pyxidicoccus trucidator]